MTIRVNLCFWLIRPIREITGPSAKWALGLGQGKHRRWTVFDQLIEIAGIVLIPMIPALILYAVLPSQATVSGPFKGLNIRLQGAFGGYFLLVLVVVGVVVERRLSETRLSANLYPKYETWEVVGFVKFPHDLEDENLDLLEILLVPTPGGPDGKLDADHKVQFSVQIPVKRTGPAPDSYEIPFNSIAFDYPNFHSSNLQFKEQFIQHERDVDTELGQITITDPIELIAKSAVPEGREEVEATAQ